LPAAIPLIAAIAGAVATAGVAGALAGTALAAAIGAVGVSVLAGLAGGIVAFGISALGNALFPVARRRDPIGEAFARTQQVRQPITPHRRIYGRARVSGPLVFIHTNPAARTAFVSQVNGGVAADYARESLLYLCHVLAGHRIDAIETVLVDNLAITDERFRGVLHVSWGLGASTQTANAMLVAETDGQWTTAHRLRGRAYMATVLKYDEVAFPSGVPNMSAVVRGEPEIYDPRTGATRWSINAALVVAHYITSPNGLRASWDEIDIPTLIASANVCDERVPLAGGGDEPRYTCSGAYEADEAPRAVLEKLLGSMAGSAVFVGGKWFIHAAHWVPPSATITQDMLRGAVTVRANRPARDLYNGVRAVYIRPAAGWQPTDAPPLRDAAALAQDDGVESDLDLPLDFCVSGYRAQRLMQIALRRNRMQRQVVVPLNMSGLNIQAMDVVTLALPRLPADTYRVTRWALSPEGGVDLVLEQDAESVYAWNPATDERPLGDIGDAIFPGGATLDTPVITVTTATVAEPTTIDIAWAAVTGAASYEAQYRSDGSSVWVDMSITGTTAAGSPPQFRASFRVRARNGDEYSEWALSARPAAPRDVSIVGTGTGYDVSFVLRTNTVRGQIFINTINDYGSATLHGVEPAGGTTAITDGSGVDKYVWVRSVRADGNFGAPLPAIVVTPGDTGTGGSGGQGDGFVDDGGYSDPGADSSGGDGGGDAGSPGNDGSNSGGADPGVG